MTDRSAPPGQEAEGSPDPTHRFTEVVDRQDLARQFPWDQYLEDPSEDRLGICCSGGGMRSACYALGALQVLRERGVLTRARYLAAVSGGDYMTVAHAVVVSETLQQDGVTSMTAEEVAAKEREFFGPLAPWARGSPEEQHLRDQTTYLAPGLKGKAWLALIAFSGMLRHMVPFAAWIVLAATALGVAFSRWLGPTVRGTNGHVAVSLVPEALVVAGLALLIGALLLWRQHVAKATGDAKILASLQQWAVWVLAVQALVVVFGIGLPALLIWIHHHNLYRSLASKLGFVAGVEGGSLGIGGALGQLVKRGAKSSLGQKVLPKLSALAMYLIGPIVIGIPFVAVAYFVTRRANGFFWPATLAGASAVMILLYWYVLDETTSSAHLFYRERLATAFVGMRTAVLSDETSRGLFGRGQPPWKKSIKLSGIVEGRESAKLPHLVVCAAVNVSDDVVPPGRLAGTFTFEHDYSGGPLTGYVPTATLEEAAGEGVLTLPAMMAIAGAALSPSMGKMTRPWARVLLALFNARLGVWLPNPLRISDFVREPKGLESIGPRRVREARSREETQSQIPPKNSERVDRGLRRARRPGTWYVFREALGLNDLGQRYVYVTDGGHWDNLGLVELLRRGCGQILCFDAAGDDIKTFHTLSEAIALARSDLGVEIGIDMSPLVPDDQGVSTKPFVVGAITYPDGTRGVLIFAKAAMDECAPQDCKDYRLRSPRFPAEGFADLWVSDRQFESYRALGAHAAREALKALRASTAGFGQETPKLCGQT